MSKAAAKKQAAAKAAARAAPVSQGKADVGIKNDAGSGAAANSTTSNSTLEKDKLFDDKFSLIDKNTGLPLSDTLYTIKRASGALEEGKTDSEGHTHLLASIAKTEPIEIYI